MGWAGAKAHRAPNGPQARRGRVPGSMDRNSILALVCCAAISGCSATLPEVVRVPIVQSCLTAPYLEKPVTSSEGEIKAMQDYEATLTVYSEWLTLKSYSEKADALLSACR